MVILSWIAIILFGMWVLGLLIITIFSYIKDRGIREDSERWAKEHGTPAGGTFPLEESPVDDSLSGLEVQIEALSLAEEEREVREQRDELKRTQCLREKRAFRRERERERRRRQIRE